MTDALPPHLDPPAAVAPRSPSAIGGPKLGARAPAAGDFVFTIGAGAAILLPAGTAEARVGLGGGTSLELRYRNLAVVGHLARARFTWATPVSSTLTFGLALNTGVGSLAQADGAKFGIDLSSLSLGNDWDVGHELVLTWTRPHQAHVTWSLGPNYALAGPRYSTYDDRSWEWDARWQSVTATVIGEWEITRARRFFLRLDALFLIKADTVPYGFLPTFTIGHAWST